MQKARFIISILLLFILFISVPPVGAYQEIEVKNGGTIQGKAFLTGNMPPPRVYHLILFPNIDMCSEVDTDDELNRVLLDFKISEDNGLKDVMILLEKVEAGKPFNKKPLLIDAINCKFLPDVNAVRQGEVFKVNNKDAVMHNSQVYQKERGKIILNIPIPAEEVSDGAVHFQKNYKIYQMICGMHEFMQTWGYRVQNPYYSITGREGSFKIDNIPPGDYILHAWHYLMDTQTRKIHLTENSVIDLKFEFDGSQVVRPLYETIKSGRIKKDAAAPGTAKGLEVGKQFQQTTMATIKVHLQILLLSCKQKRTKKAVLHTRGTLDGTAQDDEIAVTLSLSKREPKYANFCNEIPGSLSLLIIILILTLCGSAGSLFALTLPSATDMPESITVRGKQVALKNLKNPFPKNSEQNIRQGGEIYIKNCFFCHGDLLDGNGLFGKSFFPPPASFIHSQSILTQPESFAYWRIMKGGMGLPKTFSPWNSSMPAWENQLEEHEVWKVISYIYATAGKRKKESASAPSEPSLERGKQVYREKCAYCHGDKGKGDGPSAKFSSPKPRNFIKGHIKLRSTPFGKIPTDQDIFDAITKGMRATTMPGWGHLPESDRWSLVLYLKSLSKKFEKFVKKGKSHKILKVPEPPPFTLESAASGKELFIQNCSGCHGVKGRGDGASTGKIVDIETDAIWPRNLSKSWTFRRGTSRKQLFKTLRTGLSLTAMPQFSPRIFKDEQIWDIVHYVQTLSPSQKPEIKPVIKVKRASSLPSQPDDPAWKTADSYFFPLGGQIIESGKTYFPVTDNIIVKALHNGDEIAIYLHWDDPSFDPALSGQTTVKESPAPPLPPHLQAGKSEEDEETPAEPQEFPDAIALQFPVVLDTPSEKPYFLNGDPDHPVNLWKWESHPMQAREIHATGLDHWQQQPDASQGVSSKAMYEYGRYHLVMKRKLKTNDGQNDIQFQTGQPIPVAFNIWDGSSGERGSKKAVSSWFEMVLE